jgi:hypothetical protein
MNCTKRTHYGNKSFLRSWLESSPAGVEPKPFSTFKTTRPSDWTHSRLHQLKRKLLRAALEETPETGSFKQLCGTANQAADLAWATSHPFLVFPQLFDEMVTAVRERFQQDQISDISSLAYLAALPKRNSWERLRRPDGAAATHRMSQIMQSNQHEDTLTMHKIVPATVAIHFTDGTTQCFEFVAPEIEPRTLASRLEKFLVREQLLIQLSDRVLVIPMRSIKCMEFTPVPHLPSDLAEFMIRNARPKSVGQAMNRYELEPPPEHDGPIRIHDNASIHKGK